MTAAEAGDTLVMLTQARAQLDELLMRVLRHAATVETGLDTGATTHDELVGTRHADDPGRGAPHRPAGGVRSSVTTPSGRRWRPATLRTDQARVIVAAVDALPDDVEDWVPLAATAFLLEKAGEHDAKALRILGRRLLEVIDPAAADAEEARRLEAEEARARAIASFTMTDDGHGTCHGRFTLPTPARRDAPQGPDGARGRGSPRVADVDERTVLPPPAGAGVHGLRRDPSRRHRHRPRVAWPPRSSSPWSSRPCWAA